jgi:hypothetical protein
MSDLSPECAPTRTLADYSEFMGSRPEPSLSNDLNLDSFIVRLWVRAIHTSRIAAKIELAGLDAMSEPRMRANADVGSLN